jgi:hypothetical protein
VLEIQNLVFGAARLYNISQSEGKVLKVKLEVFIKLETQITPQKDYQDREEST